MPRSDYILSMTFHLLVLISVAFLSSYSPPIATDLDESISVSLRSFSVPAPVVEEPPQVIEQTRPTIPQTVTQDEAIEYVADPTTIQEEAVIEPKPEPVREETTTPEPAETIAESNESPGIFGDSTTDVSEAVAGSKFSGLGVDNASFNYSYWFDLAIMKIERRWTNPVYSSQPLACKIYFQVISSGRVLKVEIEESSGIAAYDRACKRAVEQSRPLPPLPPDYADEILGVHLVFPYQPG